MNKARRGLVHSEIRGACALRPRQLCVTPCVAYALCATSLSVACNAGVCPGLLMCAGATSCTCVHRWPSYECATSCTVAHGWLMCAGAASCTVANGWLAGAGATSCTVVNVLLICVGATSCTWCHWVAEFRMCYQCQCGRVSQVSGFVSVWCNRCNVSVCGL